MEDVKKEEGTVAEGKNPAQPDGVTEPAKASSSDVNAQGTGKGGSRVENRIHKLVSERNKFKAELERVTKLIPADSEPEPDRIESKGSDNKVAVLEEQMWDMQEEIFKARHPDLDDEDMGMISAIALSNDLVDARANKVDFSKAYQVYNKMLEKKAKVPGQTIDTPVGKPLVGTANSNAGAGVKKDPRTMTEQEIKEEFFKKWHD